MLAKSIVLLSDNASAVTLFKAMGFDAQLTDKQKVKNMLVRAIEKYRIIYLSSSLYSFVEDVIEKTDCQPYPIITLLDTTTDGASLSIFLEKSKKILGDRFVVSEGTK